MRSYELPSLIDSPSNESITDLLVERAKQTPNLPLFAIEKTPGVWTEVSAKNFLIQVQDLAKGFIASGIKPGDAVGIMSRTRYEWALIDFALWFAGAVSVPVYETSAPAQIEWVLADSDAVALIIESSEHQKRFDSIKAMVPSVKQVWSLEDDSLVKLVAKGKDITSEQLEKARTSLNLDSLATIIYTSGTTGKPKGCELLHRGFVDLSKNSKLELPEVVKEGHSTVMFLPLAHVYARFISILCVHAGIKVGHQPDTTNVAAAMQSFHPDFLLAVPRVFEKVYNSAEQKAEAGGKGKIFRKAVQVAIDYSRALDAKGGPSIGLTLQHKVFDILVYKKLRAAMGGKVKYAVSGGAPLGERLGHFYRAIGLIVLEGYGLTETSAPAMIGRVTDAKIGKVGRVLPGCGVKIADDGEILLIKRMDSGIWLYPTGWADVGYSASEVAVKEVLEETGIECEVVQLLAVLDGLRMGFTRIPLYSLVFHCRAVGGEVNPHPMECADAGWFSRDALPSPLASYDQWGELAFAAIDGEAVSVRYDPPRQRPWRIADV